MATELLNYAEIKLKLKEPISEKVISTKKQGGTTIRFVNVTDIKDLLDERLGANHWESRVSDFKQIGDFIVMTVSISINAADGVYTHEGTGHEKANHSGFGDLASNSYAQAFRRAAEGHGLGRELWRLELSDEQWNLPATADQIADLHNHKKRLGKEESKMTLYYTKDRVELFGEMTVGEADTALKNLVTMKTPAKK